MKNHFKKAMGALLAASMIAGSMPAAVMAAEMPAADETAAEETTISAADADTTSEEQNVPAEEPNASVEGENASAEAQTIPAEEQIAPAEEETVLPEEVIAPAEEETVPAGEEAVPAKEPALLESLNTARPDQTSVTKLTVGTKKLSVQWNTLPGQVDGYQLQYGTVSDFSSDTVKLKVRGDTTGSTLLTGLKSGKKYYVRVRGYRTVDGKKVYSKWSDTKSVKLTYNKIRINGSSLNRSIYVRNPKSSLKNLRVAVWTAENGQDDLVWYPMKRTSDGSWKAVADVAVLVHEGTAIAHVYANEDTFVGEGTFISPAMGFPICYSEEEYIERIAPAVQAACAKYGYLPSVLIAQSCLENGYGIPAYWDNPEISALLRFNNMVGLKSELLNSSWYDKTVWPGKSIVKKTPEEYGGVPVIITDSFRVYDSIEQSFEDYLLFMKYASNYGYGGTPKYGEKILRMKNPEKLIKAVSSRGYATGSTYPDSVMRIINKHNLTKYDK